MTQYNPPHEVRDDNKLNSMIEALESGKELPPILVQGYTAFTGSHRIAAWDYCEIEAEVVELSYEDYIAAMQEMGLDEYDEIYHLDEFCAAVYKVTNDPDVKSAVKDQQ